MTKNDLYKIYYLDKEMKMWQEELRSLEYNIGIKSPSLTGMPSGHGGEPNSMTEQEAIEIANCKAHIETMLLRIQKAKNEVYAYISTVDDSLMRQIIKYRCVSLLKWDQIAGKIRGGNTADGLKQAYSRYIRDHFPEEKDA